jgi:pyrroline-5-carboxylate reductase
MNMQIGFLGTGAITAAIVTGLNSGGEGPEIRLSPRNAAIAAELENRFPRVSVASSNQAVLDECEVAVIAVRPQIAPEVLSELRFRGSHNVISLVSGLPIRRLRELVAPATRIARAVPLPSTAKRRCPTPIYPPDRVAAGLFASLGAAIEVETEGEFDALCTATATMATYFAFADGVASWLARNGVPQTKARDYVARIFSGLAQTALESPERSFPVLAAEHATKGGTNEQILRELTGHGVFENFTEALDGVMRRVTAASR